MCMHEQRTSNFIVGDQMLDLDFLQLHKMSTQRAKSWTTVSDSEWWNENIVIAVRGEAKFKIGIGTHRYETLPITITSTDTKHISQIWVF
jgi:hypothetical protein